MRHWLSGWCRRGCGRSSRTWHRRRSRPRGRARGGDGGGGRSRCDGRAVPAAITLVATSGCAWRQLSPVFGASWQRVHRRFTGWPRAPNPTDHATPEATSTSSMTAAGHRPRSKPHAGKGCGFDCLPG
ncbi:transposase [Streptomyces sp. NPDC054794]